MATPMSTKPNARVTPWIDGVVAIVTASAIAKPPIGVMMALGMKRGRVAALVVAESMIVTAVGLLLGFSLAGLGVFLLRGGIEFGAYAESLGRLGSANRIVPHLRPGDLGIPLIVALVASLLASLWPALRAAGLRPGAALRRI